MHSGALSVAEYVPQRQLTHVPVLSAPPLHVHTWPGEQNGRPRGSREPAKLTLLVGTMPSTTGPRAMLTKAACDAFTCRSRLLSSYSIPCG
eukprot:3104329-Prymnesium_polylepis.1